MLFADLRGYTELSEKSEGHDVADLLHGFYDECAEAAWKRDGIINKFIGDAVLAIFNFPMMRDDHVERAVLAGVDIQRRCAEKQKLTTSDSNVGPMRVGAGIHTGRTSIGEVGTAYKDFTVVGPVVNMASRIQGAAQSGEVLVLDRPVGVGHPLGEQAHHPAMEECGRLGIVDLHRLEGRRGEPIDDARACRDRRCGARRAKIEPHLAYSRPAPQAAQPDRGDSFPLELDPPSTETGMREHGLQLLEPCLDAAPRGRFRRRSPLESA